MIIKGERISSEYTHYPVRLNISTTLTNANFRITPSPPNYYVIQAKTDATAFGIFAKCDLVNDYITDLYEYDLSLPYFDDRVTNTLSDIIVVAQDIIDIIALLDFALAVLVTRSLEN